MLPVLVEDASCSLARLGRTVVPVLVDIPAAADDAIPSLFQRQCRGGHVADSLKRGCD